MASAGLPSVPLPATFLFDSNSTFGSVAQSLTQSPGAQQPRQNTRPQQQLQAKHSEGPPAGVTSLAGCSLEFLLRPNSTEGREQALELHISQLRASLVELSEIHRHADAQARHYKSKAEAQRVVAHQQEELASLQQNLAAVQDGALLARASHDNDAPYQEAKVLRDMQRRVHAHAQEATAAWQAAQAAKVAAAAAEARLDACAHAHRAERATLATELADLRAKCQHRQGRAAEAEEAAQRSEAAAAFAEQQRVTAQAAAQQADARAGEALAALRSELATAKVDVDEACTLARDQETRAAAAQVELTQAQAQRHAPTQTNNAAVQLAEAHASVEWYESRVAELEATDAAAQLRRHQAELAAVREAAAAEARDLRAQLLAAGGAARCGGAEDERVRQLEAELARWRAQGSGGAGAANDAAVRERDALAAEVGELRARLGAAEGAAAPAAAAAPASRPQTPHSATDGADALNALLYGDDGSDGGAGAEGGGGGEAELWRALEATAHALGIEGALARDRGAAAVGGAVAAAAAAVHKALSEERMRAEALLHALHGSRGAPPRAARGVAATTQTDAPAAAPDSAHPNSGSGSAAASPTASGEAADAAAVVAACSSSSSADGGEERSAQRMLERASAELQELQGVNEKLLARVRELQARAVVPRAEARAALAGARAAAVAEGQAALDAKEHQWSKRSAALEAQLASVQSQLDARERDGNARSSSPAQDATSALQDLLADAEAAARFAPPVATAAAATQTDVARESRGDEGAAELLALAQLAAAESSPAQAKVDPAPAHKAFATAASQTHASVGVASAGTQADAVAMPDSKPADRCDAETQADRQPAESCDAETQADWQPAEGSRGRVAATVSPQRRRDRARSNPSEARAPGSLAFASPAAPLHRADSTLASTCSPVCVRVPRAEALKVAESLADSAMLGSECARPSHHRSAASSREGRPSPAQHALNAVLARAAEAEAAGAPDVCYSGRSLRSGGAGAAAKSPVQQALEAVLGRALSEDLDVGRGGGGVRAEAARTDHERRPHAWPHGAQGRYPTAFSDASSPAVSVHAPALRCGHSPGGVERERRSSARAELASLRRSHDAEKGAARDAALSAESADRENDGAAALNAATAAWQARAARYRERGAACDAAAPSAFGLARAPAAAQGPWLQRLSASARTLRQHTARVLQAHSSLSAPSDASGGALPSALDRIRAAAAAAAPLPLPAAPREDLPHLARSSSAASVHESTSLARAAAVVAHARGGSTAPVAAPPRPPPLAAYSFSDTCLRYSDGDSGCAWRRRYSDTSARSSAAAWPRRSGRSSGWLGGAPAADALQRSAMYRQRSEEQEAFARARANAAAACVTEAEFLRAL